MVRAAFLFVFWGNWFTKDEDVELFWQLSILRFLMFQELFTWGGTSFESPITRFSIAIWG